MPPVDILDDEITITATPGDRINILDNTLCVSVALTALSVNRRVRSNQVDVDADRNMIRVSKKILDSPELKAITKLDTKIRAMLRNYALPGTNLFRGGIYCLPAMQAPVVDDLLEQFRAERLVLCEIFYAAYERQRDAAEGQLRALHNPLDYPSLDAVRRAFGMETGYINIGVPENLAGISKTIFEREKNKQAAKISEAADEIKFALRSMLLEIVDHLRERLTPNENDLDEETGQPKVKRFHATTVTRMNSFLELFDSKNVTNDVELAALVTQARTLMNGVDPKSLRSNDALRSYMVSGLDSMKASLDTMVVSSGGRRYQRVDDDDTNEDTDKEAA